MGAGHGNVPTFAVPQTAAEEEANATALSSSPLTIDNAYAYNNGPSASNSNYSGPIGGDGSQGSPWRLQINAGASTEDPNTKTSLFLYLNPPNMPAGAENATYTYTFGGGPAYTFSQGSFTDQQKRGAGYHTLGQFVMSNFGSSLTVAGCAVTPLELKMTSSGLNPPVKFSKTYYFKRWNYGGNGCCLCP